MTEKNDIGHLEDPERKDDLTYAKTGNVVADNDARDYVDPNLVISEEENKAMRRKIHKRWVVALEQRLRAVLIFDQGAPPHVSGIHRPSSRQRHFRSRLVSPHLISAFFYGREADVKDHGLDR